MKDWVARDREETFRLYLAIMAKNLEATRPETKLDNLEALEEYCTQCTRVAVNVQRLFDRAFEDLTND